MENRERSVNFILTTFQSASLQQTRSFLLSELEINVCGSKYVATL